MGRIGSPRRKTALLCAPLIALAVFGVASPAHAEDCLINEMVAPPGIGHLTSYDLASDGRTFAVSDGHDVWRTADRGCTWERILDGSINNHLPGGQMLGPSNVVSLAVTTTSVHAVFLDVGTNHATNVRLATWRVGEPLWTPPSLPPQPGMVRVLEACDGRWSCRLVRARGDEKTVSIVFAGAPDQHAVWQSSDDGFTYRPLPGGALHPDVRTIRATEGDPGGLLGVQACNTLVHWSSSSVAWNEIPLPPLGGSSVLGAHRSRAHIVIALGDGRCGNQPVIGYLLTKDLGLTFERVDFPGHPIGFDSITLDRTGELTVLAHGGAFATMLHGKTEQRIVLPDELSARDARVVESADHEVALLTREGIYIAALKDPATYRLRLPACAPLATFDTTTRGALEVDPDPLALEVGTGERRDIAGRIDRAALPIDVAIVFDGSGSMSPAIKSMARSIRSAAMSLLAAGYDAHMSLAQYSDIEQMPYAQLVPLSPIDCRLAKALNRISSRGVHEPHLLALYQAVTGAGWADPHIEAGNGGRFRDGVGRIVVHLTDEPVDRAMPRSPSFDQTIDAFREASARHVGVRVLSPGTVGAPGEVDPVRRDLDDLGRQTGSLAPAGGLDCDGDGTPDVPAGSPMTCSFGGASSAVRDVELGDVLVQIVRASLQTAAVELTASAPEGIEIDLDAPSLDVEVNGSIEIPGDLAIRCDRPVSGRILIALQLGGAQIAERAIPAVCAVVATEAPVFIQPLQPHHIVLPRPPPIAPPAVPASSSVHATSNVVSGALARSVERSPALAYSRQVRAPQPGLMLAAGAMALAAAAAMRRREELALQPQRIDTTEPERDDL